MQIYAVSITIRIVVSELFWSSGICCLPHVSSFDKGYWIGLLFLIYFTTFTCLQLGFMLLALIWKFDFPPFMVLIIAILNDGSLFIF